MLSTDESKYSGTFFATIRGVRGIFFRGGSQFFLIFSPAWNAFSRKKIPILVDSKQILVVLKSEKKKKKKKKKKGPLHIFEVFLLTFSTFHLPFSLFRFSFVLHFPFFPCLFFPGRSAEISRWEVSGGTLTPCPPAACYATGLAIIRRCKIKFIAPCFASFWIIYQHNIIFWKSDLNFLLLDCT